MRVRVYRNLHRNCLSVQHKTDRGWRLLQHIHAIALRDVRFIVNESGRQRVLREKKKNVHAFIEGTVCDDFISDSSSLVYYNPYLYCSFVRSDDKTPVLEAKAALIEDFKILINSIS
jgi:hypothetical protein